LEELVASLKIVGHERVGERTQVSLQQLDAHLLLVHALLTHCDLLVQRILVLLVDNDAFVDVDGLVQVFAVEVHGRHAEHVFGGVVEQIVGHHVVVVGVGLRDVEFDAGVEC